jgi:hypothetical protein
VENLPKPLISFAFEKVKGRNISVKNEVQITEKEILPERLKQKNEKRVFSIITEVDNPELIYKLEEDEPRIKITINLRATIIKPPEEEVMEELFCHDDAKGTQLEIIYNNMLDGDYSLKTKILKKGKIYCEKKSFKERKEVIEEFIKSNVEEMPENKKCILSAEERGNLMR